MGSYRDVNYREIETCMGILGREKNLSTFFLTSWLKQRDVQFPSNSGKAPDGERVYDEPVNIYVAGLLRETVRAENSDRFSKYVYTYEIDVNQAAIKTVDNRTRFEIFRANADFRFLNLGLFSDELLSAESRTDVNQGSLYYKIASSIGGTLGCGTGLLDVLGQLSKDFDRYVKVLMEASHEYFNLIPILKGQDLEEIQEEISIQVKLNQLRERENLLLDQFNETGDLKERERLAEELSKLSDQLQELKVVKNKEV